jgi:hypothetical protein
MGSIASDFNPVRPELGLAIQPRENGINISYAQLDLCRRRDTIVRRYIDHHDVVGRAACALPGLTSRGVDGLRWDGVAPSSRTSGPLLTGPVNDPVFSLTPSGWKGSMEYAAAPPIATRTTIPPRSLARPRRLRISSLRSRRRLRCSLRTSVFHTTRGQETGDVPPRWGVSWSTLGWVAWFDERSTTGGASRVTPPVPFMTLDGNAP